MVPKTVKIQPRRVPEALPGAGLEKYTKKLNLATPSWEPFSTLGPILEAPIFYVFWGPSRRGLFRIWEPRKPPKWRPLGVMFETLAENLEYVIFEDHSMVLAGPGTHN